ncbi:Acyl-CoA N-acyltransferase [Penicillium argentinense]|uniref:Acyl-CoA N-acyltransferase n=1 Tax=Penicillium argentinense TaxID=1131581 RepID=A0A9W9KCE5_9EURO|nr:Acyl-CoA N-acyltransferase [Penicillium argentinense]KAJ5099917.1 Acyl-CoA N-acyltransferase [Penicillium argentinense]
MHSASAPLSYQAVGHLGDSTFSLQSKSTDLCLRPPTNKDLPSILEILQNNANSKFDRSLSEASIAQLIEIAQRWTSLSEPLTSLMFLICHPNHDAPIGIAGFGWIGPMRGIQVGDNTSRAGVAGLMIQPAMRGKGYGHDALKMVFHYGLHELKLVEIRLWSHSGNVPMRMLMERKFGLQTEEGDRDRVDEFGNDLLWAVTKEKLAGALSTKNS